MQGGPQLGKKYFVRLTYFATDPKQESAPLPPVSSIVLLVFQRSGLKTAERLGRSMVASCYAKQSRMDS